MSIPHDLKRSILDAAQQGDKNKLWPLIMEWGDNEEVMNCSDPFDDRCNTPLLLAIILGHIEITSLLLEQTSIDVNKGDGRKSTPLIRAVMHFRVDAVRLLLAQNAIDVNKGDDELCTPLMWACRYGNAEITKLLLSQPGILINKKNYDFKTSLAWACQNNHVELVEILLNHGGGIDVNLSDRFQTSPLHLAIFGDITEIATLLLAKENVDTNKADCSGRTPLLIACALNRIAIVRMLLDRPTTEVNAENKETGETPLAIASMRGYSEILTQLLAHPLMRVNQATSSGDTALTLACCKGNIEVVQMLASAPRIEVNQARSDGRSSLDCLALSGVPREQKKIIEAILISKGGAHNRPHRCVGVYIKEGAWYIKEGAWSALSMFQGYARTETLFFYRTLANMNQIHRKQRKKDNCICPPSWLRTLHHGAAARVGANGALQNTVTAAPSTPSSEEARPHVVTPDESHHPPGKFTDTKEYRLPNGFILHAYVSVDMDYEYHGEDSNKVNDVCWEEIREDIGQICSEYQPELGTDDEKEHQGGEQDVKCGRETLDFGEEHCDTYLASALKWKIKTHLTIGYSDPKEVQGELEKKKERPRFMTMADIINNDDETSGDDAASDVVTGKKRKGRSQDVGNGLYRIKRILRNVNGRKGQYLVRWCNTWEPYQNICHTDAFKNYIDL